MHSHANWTQASIRACHLRIQANHTCKQSAGRGKETLWELLLAALWKCKLRPSFEVRCGCASLIHLCIETRRESLIFHDNTSRLLRKAHSYSWIKELYWLNYEHAATSRKMECLKLSNGFNKKKYTQNIHTSNVKNMLSFTFRHPQYTRCNFSAITLIWLNLTLFFLYHFCIPRTIKK